MKRSIVSWLMAFTMFFTAFSGNLSLAYGEQIIFEEGDEFTEEDDDLLLSEEEEPDGVIQEDAPDSIAEEDPVLEDIITDSDAEEVTEAVETRKADETDGDGQERVTVTFDLNGGQIQKSDSGQSGDDLTSVLTAELKAGEELGYRSWMEGYELSWPAEDSEPYVEFAGWATKRDPKPEDRIDAYHYVPQEDTTLYAIWASHDEYWAYRVYTIYGNLWTVDTDEYGNRKQLSYGTVLVKSGRPYSEALTDLFTDVKYGKVEAIPSDNVKDTLDLDHIQTSLEAYTYEPIPEDYVPEYDNKTLFIRWDRQYTVTLELGRYGLYTDEQGYNSSDKQIKLPEGEGNLCLADYMPDWHDNYVRLANWSGREGETGFPHPVTEDTWWKKPLTISENITFYAVWDTGELVKRPTCTEEGLLRFPSYNEDMVLNKLEHDYGYWSIGKERSCTEDGYEYRVCNDCGYEERHTIPKYTDHTFIPVNYSATLTEDGSVIWECLYCDATELWKTVPREDQMVELNGHTYMAVAADVDWWTAEQQCEAVGGHLATITSKAENDILQTIYAADHKDNNSYMLKHAWIGLYHAGSDDFWVTGEKADYSQLKDDVAGRYAMMWIGTEYDEDASKKGTWQFLAQAPNHRMGYICEWDDYKDVQAHLWSNETTLKAPTCDEEGLRRYTCEDSDAVKDVVLPALDHDPSPEVQRVEPTATDTGRSYQICQRCGKEVNVKIIPELGSDPEKPVIVKVTPVSGSVIGLQTTIVALSTDNVDVVHTQIELSVDDGASWTLIGEADGERCETKLPEGVASGSIQLRVTASDAVGNVSEPRLVTYTADTQGPEQVTGLYADALSSVVTLHWNDVADNDFAFFRLEKQKEDGSYETVQDIDKTLGANLTKLQPDTTFVFRVAAYDIYGNRGEASETLEVHTDKDTHAPVVTQLKPDAGYVQNDRIDFSACLEDESAVAEVTIQVSENGSTWEDYDTITISENERAAVCKIQEVINVSGCTEGIFAVRVIGEDTAGNKAEADENTPYVEYMIDQTAPAKPQGLKADVSGSGVELTWTADNSDDTVGYLIYISSDGENFNKLADKVTYSNYIDYGANVGEKRYYRIALEDKAGNISEMSDAVEAVLTADTEAPVIVSCSPEDDSTVGGTSARISVLFSDNRQLQKAELSCLVTDEYGTLLSEKDTADVFAASSITDTHCREYLLTGEIPLEDLADGYLLHINAKVSDTSGNETEVEEVAVYAVDRSAPAIDNVTAEPDEENAIRITWKGYDEEDLAGYYVYRALAGGKYSLIASVKDQQFTDTHVSADELYRYRVEARDTFGNASSAETAQVCLPEHAAIYAKLNTEAVQQVRTEYTFDAKASRSDLPIRETSIDFGDGSEVQTGDAGAEYVHAYAETGEYTVTLTVTDEAGNTGTDIVKVQVEEASLLGTQTVEILDEDGNPISGMKVYLFKDDAGDEKIVQQTGVDGRTQFTEKAGVYLIGAFRDGYLPVQQQIIIGAGDANAVLTFRMEESPMVTGTLTAERMTLAEIEAAGIDISDPANQQMFHFSIHLEYGTTPITVSAQGNGSEPVICEQIIVGTRSLTPVIIPEFNVTGETEKALVLLVDVPVSGSFLKEFFDVKLHLINQASESFNLSENSVHLTIPKGLTLINAKGSEDSEDVYFESLRGGQTRDISWVLRGDEEGDYQLQADYSAVLDQFDQIIGATFTMEAPLHVYGMKAARLVADIDSKLDFGGMYFNLTLENLTDTTINLPRLDVIGRSIELYEQSVDETKQNHPVSLLAQYVDGELGRTVYSPAQEVQLLEGGESLTKEYVAYDSATEKDHMYLKKALIQAGEECGIEIEINEYAFDHYSAEDAEDKLARVNEPGSVAEMYQYLLTGENFDYYNRALDDESFWRQATQYLYESSGLFFDLDWQNFANGKEMREMTRNYIFQLLQDESFASAVDDDESMKYLSITRKLLEAIKTGIGMMHGEEYFHTDGSKSSLPSEIKDFKNVFDSAEKQKNLAQALKIGGFEGFTSRFLQIAGNAGISWLTGGLLDELHLSKEFLDATKESVGNAAFLLDMIEKGVGGSYRVLDHFQQIVQLSAVHDEADRLFRFILDDPNMKVKGNLIYDEVEAMYKLFKDGEESLGESFFYQSFESMSTPIAKHAIAGGFQIYSPDSGVVYTIMKLAYHSFSYACDWGTDVSNFRLLKVASVISLALEDSTETARTSGNAQDFIASLKYLTKSRLIGENTYIDIIKKKTKNLSNEDFRKVMEKFNLGKESSAENLNEYYREFKEKVLYYRDEIFKPIVRNTQPADPTDPGTSGSGEQGGTQTGGDTGETGTSEGGKQSGGAASCVHNYTDWKTVREATVFEPAAETGRCSICGGQTTRNVGDRLPATIKLNVSGTLPMKTGQKTNKVVASGLAAGDTIISWTSSNSKVVKVDAKGVLKAGKKAGKKAVITVKTKGGAAVSFTVKVQKAKVATKKVTVISKKITLKKGESLDLGPQILPITSADKLKCTTSRKAVARVNKKGVVKARKAGKAKITLKAGKKKVTVTVVVK